MRFGAHVRRAHPLFPPRQADRRDRTGLWRRLAALDLWQPAGAALAGTAGEALAGVGLLRLAEELAGAWAQPQPEWARKRLLVLRLIAQHKLSAEQIAEAVGVSRATVFNYLDTVESSGVGALLTRGHSGGPEPTLGGEDHDAFVEQLRQGKFRRAKEAQAWIKARTKKSLALSSVYALLGKAGGVLKVPRKTHARKAAAKTEAFKTELPARLDAATAEAAGRPVRLWVLDEHRYGLLPGDGHDVALAGHAGGARIARKP